MGFIGHKHAKLIVENPNAELKATIDIDPSKNSDFSSLEDFFNSEQSESCDFICVCTPNYLHVKHSKQVLESGINVICEKPLGLSVKECNELKIAEKESGKKVFCVLQNRYSPPIKWLKTIISENKLGELFHVQINCYWNRDDRYYFPNGKKHSWKGTKSKDGGVLFTQFSHFVDILTWTFGLVKNVTSMNNNYTHKGKTDFPDTGSIIFELENGAIGNLNYSTAVWDKNLESTVTVLGNQGSVKIGGQYMDKVEICNIKNYSMPSLEPSMPPNDYGHYKGSAQNHLFVIQNAIDFVLKNAEIDVNLEEGILSVRNIETLSFYDEE